MGGFSTLSNSRKISSHICVIKSSEPIASNSNGVYIGRTSVYKTPFFFNSAKLMNPHISVLGTTGSGKTYFLKCFLVRNRAVNDSKILIIDWNNEYKDVITLLGGSSIELGARDHANAFNLFKSQNGHQTVLNLLSEFLDLQIKEQSALSNVLEKLNSESKRITLNGILTTLEAAGDEAKELLLKASRLRGDCMFCDETTFDTSLLLDGVTSVNLLGIQGEPQRRFATSIIIELIRSAMHSMEINSRQNRIIVLDEAWKLIGANSRLGHLFREGRKYGISIVIATQLASDINNEILANSGCIMVFKLQSGSDYEVLENAGVLDAIAAKRLQELQQGSCFIRLSGKDSGSDATKFFIKRVEGFQISAYHINGDNMRITVQKEKFLKATGELVTRNEVKSRIMEYAEANSKNIDAIGLVRLMAKNGVGRPEVVKYIRALGLPDKQVVYAYENAKDVVAEG